jgi:predicted nucleic acid-binding protein
MIAADSSTIIAFIQNDDGPDVQLLDSNLAAGTIVIPPVVLAEVTSDPRLPAKHLELVQSFPVLELLDGYWTRTGLSRARVLSMKLRARLPDALIAQSCIDHDVALIQRDGDFRHFANYCGLKLA